MYKRQVIVGNLKLMEQRGILVLENPLAGTVIYIAENGVYRGYIQIADRLKLDSKKAIALLKLQGIKRLAMLTGDRKEAANTAAKELGLNLAYAELLPGDKVEKVEGLSLIHI